MLFPFALTLDGLVCLFEAPGVRLVFFMGEILVIVVWVYLPAGRLSKPFSLSSAATLSMCRQSHMHAQVLAF